MPSPRYFNVREVPTPNTAIVTSRPPATGRSGALAMYLRATCDTECVSFANPIPVSPNAIPAIIEYTTPRTLICGISSTR